VTGYPLSIMQIAGMMPNFDSLRELCQDLSKDRGFYQGDEMKPLYQGMLSSLDRLINTEGDEPLFLYVLITMMADGLGEAEFREITKLSKEEGQELFGEKFCYKLMTKKLQERCLVKKNHSNLEEFNREEYACYKDHRVRFEKNLPVLEFKKIEFKISQARLLKATVLYYRGILIEHF
jgi:hypothetical protein